MPTYNRSHFIERAFDSLVNQVYPKDKLQIIVIDDGSTDRTRTILKQYQDKYPYFRYLEQANCGPASARNLGLRQAKGDIILFIDDDCVADEHWVRDLTLAYDDPQIGGVAGQIRYVVPIDNIANRCASLYSDGEGQPLDANGDISFFVTANASFRRSVLEQVGGFDTAFPHAAQEDVDLSCRVRQSGWKLQYSHRALVHHYHHHTLSGDLRRWYQVGKAEALIRLKQGARHSVWTEVPLCLLAFCRIPFGCVRNLAKGMKPVESLMAPLIFRMNKLMLAFGHTVGYFTQRPKIQSQ